MNKEIEKMTNSYKDVFEKKMKAKNTYLSKLKIKNLEKNELLSFNNNVEYMIKNDYLYLVYNSIALQEKYEDNNDYCALFLTLTLDSPFHQFKENRNKKLIRNYKYCIGNTVNLGYKILNTFFKSLYKDFKINNKFQKIEFIRVFEPHCDFTCHLHSLIYIKKVHLSPFEKYLRNKIKMNKNLGIYKIELIENITRSSSYILKYAKKSFNFTNDNFKVYYGWRLANKIRAYTFTRQFISRDIFNKISFHFSKNFVFDEDSFEEFRTKNLYKLINNFTQLFQETTNSETGEITKKEKISAEDNMFIVNLSKNRQTIENCDNHKIIEIQKHVSNSELKFLIQELHKYNLYNNFNFFILQKLSINCCQLKEITFRFYLSNFLQTLENKKRYVYKFNNFQIYKKHHLNSKFDLVFDKKNWIRTNSLQ